MALIDEKYTDDGALREQDKVPLEDFLAFKDRTQITGRGQPFFSGREREINAFRSVANALSLGHTSNATLVIEGPPGAGKTAILAQFQEEVRSYPPTESGDRQWLPVFLNGVRAESPRSIEQAVDKAIAKRLAEEALAADDDAPAIERFRAFLGEKAGQDMKRRAREVLDRGVRIWGLGVGAAERAPTDPIEAVADRRFDDWVPWQILLLIDEGQEIANGGPFDVRGTLSSIHQGAVDAPLSICVFGLPGTWDALGDVGISRTSVHHDLNLAGLDDRESRMAIQRCFARFGIEHGEAWERAVLERSANWPQHLATYLHAALSTLKESAPSPDSIGDARRTSLTHALAMGDEGRANYYDRRIRRLTKGHPRHDRLAKAVIPLFRQGHGEPLKSEVVDLLEAPPLSLSDDRIDSFLVAAEHSGFLVSAPKGRLRMPIPSFAGYLLDEPMPPLPEAPVPQKRRNASS